VALARNPGPKQPLPACRPTCRPYGPLTTSSGATGCVVACTPYRLNVGSSIASTAATMIGNAAGSQPAITALTASFSSVACRQSGGMTPSTRAPSRPPSMAATRSGVGGMMGSPSHHARSVKAARRATGSSSRVMSATSGIVVAGAACSGKGVGGLFLAVVAATPVAALPSIRLASCSKAWRERRATESGRSPPSG